MAIQNQNNRINSARAWFAGIAALLGLSGCGGSSVADPTSTGLIYCSEGNPASFNPQLDASGITSDATSHQLYNRLLDFDPATGTIEPGLASSWLVSEDGLIYTFQLRKKVTFHSTEYFTPSRFFNADDVMFSFNRWRQGDHPYHKVSGGVYPYFESLGLNDIIKDIKRINGYRVEIHLNRPDSSFLANLATDFAVILSEEYATQLTAAGQQARLDEYPVGTGPYKFVSYRKNRFIRYQRHQDYWQQEADLDKLIFDITPSSSMRIAKLMTGECDAIAFPAYSEISILRDRNDIRLDERPGLNIGFWAFNTAKPPFDNPDVRKALAMAIDKNTLLEAVYFGSAVIANGILPPSSWAHQDDVPDANYNPVMAKALLAENGIEPGFTMNIWAMPVERAYNPNARKMAELIKNYLQQIDINVNIVSYEWSRFRERLKQGLHDSVLIGWSADNGDPDNFYRPLLTCSAIESGTNRAMWCSDEYDALVNSALNITDTEARTAYYHQANALLREQMPLVPIAHAYRFQAHRLSLEGLVINPYGGIRFGGAEKPE